MNRRLHLSLFWLAIGLILVGTMFMDRDPDYKAEHIERCDLAWQFATTSADTLVLDSIFECDPPKDTIIAWWREQNDRLKINRRGTNRIRFRPAKTDTN